MSKQYRLVVFDWEGTISDTLGQIINCVDKEAQRLHFGELDMELARQSVGLGLVKALRKVYPQLSLHQHEQLLAAVQHCLLARFSEVYLIPGVKEFIQKLYTQGIFLAIATNKGQQGLNKALQFSGLNEYIKVTRSAGILPPKPDPQMLEEILAEFAVTPDEALMIGDSSTDMEMAKSVHMDVIGVDFYHQQAELLKQAGALAVFDDYKLVAEFLQLAE